MRLVILESPYAGDVLTNLNYAYLCVRDCLQRGEAPIASHILFTNLLTDTDPQQRALGISAGLAWSHKADAAVFYLDRGWSPGMKQALKYHFLQGTLIEERHLYASRDALPPLQRTETMNIGQRIKGALEALSGDLSGRLDANATSDATTRELLTTLGDKTTVLQGQVENLQTEIDNLPAGTDTTALQAEVDGLKDGLDSLNEAFPDEETQHPDDDVPEEVPVEEAPTPTENEG